MKPTKTIQTLIASPEFAQKISLALPKTTTPERFVRMALNAVARNPSLLGCTPASVMQCLLDLSSYGIEADGRRAHLLPYRDNKSGTLVCTLILDYKGIAELVRRSGDVSSLHADVVCENDHFVFNYGSGASLTHRPSFKDRGKIICAYSYVKLKDGGEDFLVMGIDEIEEVRSRSKSSRSGPWVTDFAAMAAKTIFRRHSKWLPLSYNVRDAIEHDDDVAPAPEKTATASVVRSPIDLLLDDDNLDMTPSPEPALATPITKKQAKPPVQSVPESPEPEPASYDEATKEALRNIPSVTDKMSPLERYCHHEGISWQSARERFEQLRIDIGGATHFYELNQKLASAILTDATAIFDGLRGGSEV